MNKRAISKALETWPGRKYCRDPGIVAVGDATEFLSHLPASIADIVFLDPPFNLGKRYGLNGPNSDSMDEQAYGVFLNRVLASSSRILRDGGALYLYHLPKWGMRLGSILEQQGLIFRHWIAVSMKNGFVRGRRLYPAHYALLYFTKGPPRVFNRPKIPAPRCRHCREFVKDYGGYTSYVRRGINVSDIWDDFSPVRHTHTKTRIANELPVALASRVIHISGKRGDLLVDPFCGSGTALVAATRRGLRYLGCDLNPEYARGAHERVGAETDRTV